MCNSCVFGTSSFSPCGEIAGDICFGSCFRLMRWTSSRSFFMFPLVFWTLLKHWKGWRTLLAVMAIIGFTIALWYVPMALLSGGYQNYSAVALRQFNYHMTHDSILFGNSLFSHFRMIKEFLLSLIGAAFIPLFYLSLYLVTARRDFLLRMRDWRTRF